MYESGAPSNTRLERTRHERAPLLSCVGEPIKRSVRRLSHKSSEITEVFLLAADQTKELIDDSREFPLATIRLLHDSPD